MDDILTVEPVTQFTAKEANVFDSEFERSLFELRKSKLEEIEKLGQAAYPNQFPASHTVPQVRARWDEALFDSGAEALEANRVTVAVAGRIMAIRAPREGRFFATLQQDGQRLQIYVRLDAVGEQGFALYKLLDLGDHIGVSGYLFRTRTGELTIQRREADPFLAQGYAGAAGESFTAWPTWSCAIASVCGSVYQPEAREVFVKRARALKALRQFFDERAIWKSRLR